jgi:hypothetical protein
MEQGKRLEPLEEVTLEVDADQVPAWRARVCCCESSRSGAVCKLRPGAGSTRASLCVRREAPYARLLPLAAAHRIALAGWHAH